MRLKQIRLSGFKSFVDPTSIHLPGQLVGIVGPNGCGKSNVIDAVRWVLGETRASALRGDSMQDVIFNGSGNRKPHARASVELIFDNASGRAAGQWSQYAELSVRRVLQRDGDSSYFINNTHVRRRDITDMFLGTGLGPRAYAIIEQGMISRVIEAKPDELRVFLEEAAGVSRYKERRKETEHRLTDTRENLARVDDIRIELGAQIDKLQAQAEVATRFREFQADLQFKQQMLWFLRRRDAAAERDRHAQEIGKAANALEAENAALTDLERRIETARAAHYREGDALNAAQAALYAANSDVARLESELRHVEETRQRLENQLNERRGQLAAWREQRSQLTQALHMWSSRQGGARQRVADTEAGLAAESAKLPGAESAFRASQDSINESRAGLMRAEGRLQLEEANLANLQRSLAALAQRRERLEAEIASLSEPDHAALEAARQGTQKLGEAADAALADLNALLEAGAALEAREAETSEALAQARQYSTAADAQLATLRQIQKDTEDNAPLHGWLEKHQLAALPPFWQKLRIDVGWETAVESVLREKLHALEISDASAIAPLAEDQPPTKASFYAPAAAQFEPGADGRVPLAAKVHALDDGLAGAISDWMSGVFVVESDPDAGARAALPHGCVLVNRAGHQFTRHTVSFHAPDPLDAGLLARQTEIEALEVRCSELARVEARARDEATEAEAASAAHRASIEAARDGIRVLQQQLHDAQIAALKLTQANERFLERSTQLRDELAQAAQESAREAEREAELAQARSDAEQGIREARRALDEIRVTHDGIELALAEQRRKVQQAERDAQDARFGERECAAKISEIDVSVRVIDQQIEQAELEIAKLSGELAVDPIPEVRKSLDVCVEARIACEKTLAQARDAVEGAASALRELEESRAQVEARIAPLRDRVGELKLKEQAASINHDQYAGQLAEAGADEARLAAESGAAPRPPALQAEIARLTQAIQELGAVNLAALEELRTSTERKEYLDKQSADLEEAVATLEDAIRRIDRETRELLRETFESVNRHFGSLFPQLFGGGEARLIMTGEEILDAGVQVMAQPPGKRNTSIHLLSGGEKALTAISLVFAMFQLNPAPFCLLDEVDAPLDDSNTGRFCSLVRQMSSHTQFMFISHNKITMEIAEQLIGVTMPESGVSRVVAVDIEEALRMKDELAA
ncbi:MAG: chromosome segregation protein SMC [Burkholderiales bacterium]